MWSEEQEREHNKRVDAHNKAANDAFFSSIAGDPLGGIYKGMKARSRAKADAAEAEAAAQAAAAQRAWEEATAKGEARFNKATECADAGDRDKAITIYLSAASLNGAYRSPSFTRVAEIFLYNKNDYNQAVFYANKALDDDSNISTADVGWMELACLTRAEAYFKRMEGQSGEDKERNKKLAIEDFKEVIDMSKKKSENYNFATRRLRNMGLKHSKRHPNLTGFFGGIAFPLCSAPYFRMLAVAIAGTGFISGALTFVGVVIFGFGIGFALARTKKPLINAAVIILSLASFITKGLSNTDISIPWLTGISMLLGIIAVVSGVTTIVIDSAKRKRLMKIDAEVTQRDIAAGKTGAPAQQQAAPQQAAPPASQQAAPATQQAAPQQSAPEQVQAAPAPQLTPEQAALVDLYNQGKAANDAKDYAKAAEIWQQAAEQGQVNAQSDLGYAYAKGQGVPEDMEKAAYWYTKAAEQGDVFAQFELGVFYQQGTGVPQDAVKASEWFLKAAEQGDAYAQQAIGVCYYNGEGVDQSNRKAVEWIRKAAAQGNQKALKNVEFLKSEGLM